MRGHLVGDYQFLNLPGASRACAINRGLTAESRVNVDMKMETIAEWNILYEKSEAVPAAQVLIDNAHLLPNNGLALDIACGLAENAFFLAKQGLVVDAWDNANVAVKRVNKKSAETALPVTAILRDIHRTSFPHAYYDVIVLTHYLAQDLSLKIMSALKPGGLLYFQTFTQEKVSEQGPQMAKFRLQCNELMTMFAELKILVYREEGKLGDISLGFRNEAMIVARKSMH